MSSARPLKKNFPLRGLSKFTPEKGLPREWLSIFSLGSASQNLFFSWRVPLKIYLFFLESAS